jgi:hypothetical protein
MKVKPKMALQGLTLLGVNKCLDLKVQMGESEAWASSTKGDDWGLFSRL